MKFSLNYIIFARVRELLKGKSPTPLSPVFPEDVFRVSEKDLRACGISWSKASYVKDLAEKVKRGVVEIEKLDKLSDTEVINELIKVKGIGRWTVEMFLMFTLARPNIFPLDDLGIQKGFKKLIDREVSKLEMEKFSHRWSPYRTIACWYIWRILEND